MRTPIAANPLAEAMALHRKGRLNPAKKLYREHLQRRPNDVDALEMLGGLHGELGEFADAARVLEKAVAANPKSLNSLFNLGVAQRKTGCNVEAEASFRNALALAPQAAHIHHQLALCAFALGRPAEAVARHDAALRLDPKLPNALVNKAQALAADGRLVEAAKTYDEAHRQEPQAADILSELGGILLQLNQIDQATHVLARARELDPQSIVTLARLGAAHRLARRFEQAIAVLEPAAKLEREPGVATFELIANKQMIADWQGFERLVETSVKRMMRQPEGASMIALQIADDPVLHQRSARAYVATRFATAAPAFSPQPRQNRRLRIGYVSPDFGDHPLAHALAGVLRAHDRKSFEIHGFFLDPEDGTLMRRQIRSACEHAHDVAGLGTADIAERVRAAGLDIAVDLAGHSEKARTGIFAMRAAPVQVNFLGYPGTIGASWMDYIVLDSIVAPPTHAGYYDERIVRLPDCYLPNDHAANGLEPPPSRAAAGLPATGRILAAFNGIAKLNPALFSCWMRILNATPDTNLWLPNMPEAAARNLRREAEARGVKAERLIIAPFVKSRADHLARLQLADLMLDSLPYNGHTTTAEALWAGVPVVTVLGRSFPARVAASVLTCAGVPELIAETLPAYEAKALDILHNPEKLSGLRARLVAARKASPLFDTARFTRNLEQAFTRMAATHADARPPEAFDI